MFRVFQLNTRNVEMNLRYLKIEYLKENKFEGFIFGNSGVNGFPVSEASKLTGLKFYNFTVPNESPQGVYQKFSWLINNQPVKHLILGESVFTQNIPTDLDHNNLVMFEHPEVSNESILSFYWRYLWVRPKRLASVFYSYFVKKDTWWKFDIKTGHYHFPILENMIRVKDKEYIKNYRDTFVVVRNSKPNLSINKSQLKYLKRTIELAHEHNVRVTVINPPHAFESYKHIELGVFKKWMKSMVSIVGELWDFSGSTSISKNPKMYFDTAHYAFEAGALALRRIFAPAHKSLKLHPDYGQKVTSGNVDKRLLIHQRVLEFY